MAGSVSIYDKFASAPASVPWPTLAGARFGPPIMADIDGDGRAECIAVVPDPDGVAPPSWGVLSYFSYSSYYAGWAQANSVPLDASWSDPNDAQLVSSFCSLPALVPGLAAGSLTQMQGQFRTAGETLVLLLDGTNRALSLVLFPQLGATSPDTLPGPPQPVFQSQGSSIPGSGGGASWSIGNGQSLIVGDVDGDGLDEIVLSQVGAGMAVLKWDTGQGGLVALTVAAAEIDGYPFLTPLQLWTADVDGDGVDEIVFIDELFDFGVLRFAASSGLSLVQRNSGSIPPAQSGGAAFSIGAGMQVAVGDINGDGKDEVVVTGGQVSNGIDGLIGVLGWQNGSLSVTSVASGTITTGSDSWTIPYEQTIAIGQVQAGGGNVLVSVGIFPGQEGIALLGCAAGTDALSLLYATGGTIAADGAAAAFSLQLGTTVALADVDGDGVQEIILQSDIEQQMAVVGWSDDSGDLSAIWYASSTVGTSTPLGTWGIGFMAQAPANTSPGWLNTDQSAIYQQISGSLSPAITGAVRSEYTNAGNATGNFSAWAEQLQQQVKYVGTDNQDLWSWTTKFGDADVTSVFNQIAWELYGVNELSAYAIYYALYLADVQTQRHADLSTVTGNLISTPAATTSISYWPGQIVIAALWGLASLAGAIETGGLALAAGLSTFASLLGSALSAPSSAPDQPSGPTVEFEYSKLSGQIDDEAGSVTDVFGAQMTGFLADPVKLGMLGPLLLGPWPTYAYKSLESAVGASPYNRFVFYRMLLGTQFQWSHWALTGQDTPWIVTWNNLGDAERSYLSVPAGSYDVDYGAYPDGSNDIYLLQGSGSAVPNPSLPTETLVTDLFATLNIRMTDVIAGNYGWSVPIFEWAKGDDVGSWSDGDLHFYITNTSDATLWYTFYWYSDGVASHIKECGAVAPGVTYQSANAYDFTFQGDTFRLAGQYAEQGSETSIWMGEPIIVQGGTTLSYNSWYQFWGDSSNYGWTCTNPGSGS